MNPDDLFRDKATEDIFNGVSSKRARQRLPGQLVREAAREMDFLLAASSLRDVGAAPGNTLKPLKRDRKGQHSIRINDQYRICFV